MTADMDSSIDLLRRAQAGDREALNDLLERYWPRLRAWASGRLPPGVRSMRDTGDLIQDAILNALTKIDLIEIRSEGALLAYLRTSVKHAIVDEFRRHHRRGPAIEVPDDEPARETSPLEAAIGLEALENYDRGLATLNEPDRLAVILRVEFGLSYEEIAQQLGKPSAAAARMMVTRALARLAKAMGYRK